MQLASNSQVAFNPELLRKELLSLDDTDLSYLMADLKWKVEARPNQLTPAGDWLTWLAVAGRGWGKGLCLDTDIVTPLGVVKMGDLKTGDLVLAPDGTWTKIIAHEPYTPAKMFRFKFSTGETIDCDGDHLWFTQTAQERKVGRAGTPAGKVRDTYSIVESFWTRGRQDPNHFVPLSAPMRGEETSLPIDPYLLGAWLGDGTKAGPYLCVFEHEFFQQLERYNPATIKSNKNLLRFEQLATKLLKQLGVFKAKAIPEVYQQASFNQRLELLQGLMDTDGSIDANGSTMHFANTNRKLIDDVRRLVASLGLKPRVRYKRVKLVRKDGSIFLGDAWYVTWTAYRDLPCFKLSRKLERQREPKAQSSRHRARTIVSYEELPVKQVRCLTVDHPSRLYCATASLIPTHNTRTGAEWCRGKAWRMPGSIGHIMAPTHNDLRGVCFEGPAGLLTIIPSDLIADYNRSLQELRLINGSLIRGFAADSPDRIRGPQSHYVWGDELATWMYIEEAMSNIDFSNRLVFVHKDGSTEEPQSFYTTTPRPLEVLRKMVKDKTVHVVRGSTYENKQNLAPGFFAKISVYEGTTLGRQELHAEILDPEEAGIVKRSQIKLWPHDKALPRMRFVLMSLDTAFTEATLDKRTKEPDYSACGVFGVFEHEKKLNAMLLDAWQDQVGLPALIERVQKERKLKYGQVDRPIIEPLFGPNRLENSGKGIDTILIEDKGSGISLRQMLADSNIMAHAFNPGKASKLERLHVVSPYFTHGRVWAVESEKRPGNPKTWADPLITQLCSFTGEGSIKHDDFVDVTTQAIIYISRAFDMKLDSDNKPPPVLEDAGKELLASKKRNAYG